MIGLYSRVLHLGRLTAEKAAHKLSDTPTHHIRTLWEEHCKKQTHGMTTNCILDSMHQRDAIMTNKEDGSSECLYGNTLESVHSIEGCDLNMIRCKRAGCLGLSSIVHDS